MATESHPTLLSYDDYAAIDDDRRAQVIDGVLIVTPAASPRHQRLVFRLARKLADFADACGGEVFSPAPDVVLRAERPAQVVQPDVMYFSPHRLTLVGRKNVQGAPDVAVEVLSPSNFRLDVGRKRDLYAQYGVPEYWMLPLHADRIEVLVLGPDGKYGRPTVFEPGDILTSTAMPGLALDVAAVFAGLEDADDAES